LWNVSYDHDYASNERWNERNDAEAGGRIDVGGQRERERERCRCSLEIDN